MDLSCVLACTQEWKFSITIEYSSVCMHVGLEAEAYHRWRLTAHEASGREGGLVGRDATLSSDLVVDLPPWDAMQLKPRHASHLMSQQTKGSPVELLISGGRANERKAMNVTYVRMYAFMLCKPHGL